MIRCFHCGTDNLDGSEYCDECGKKLNASPAGAPRPGYVPPPKLSSQAGQASQANQIGPPPPPAFTRENVTPKPATPYTPPPPPVQVPSQQANAQKSQPQAVTEVAGLHNQTAAFNGQTGSLQSNSINIDSGRHEAMNRDLQDSGATQIHAKLVIQRGGKVGKEFAITESEALIGRWDADGGIFPDIDLDQDDPEAKVSRRHARIQITNNQYLIEDLGSTNGTFINRGPRLLPGNKQPLSNGDEIIVGKTFLKFIVI